MTTLRYGDYDYIRHSTAKNGLTYWRCPSYRKGCRALISARFVDGYMIINKTKDQIIHAHTPINEVGFNVWKGLFESGLLAKKPNSTHIE